MIIFIMNFYSRDFDYSLTIANEVEPLWMNRQEMQCGRELDRQQCIRKGLHSSAKR